MAEKWKPPTKESESPRVYTKREERVSADKGSHKERSKGNDGRKKGHNGFWKKQEKRKDE
jgi:hypothetical protein